MIPLNTRQSLPPNAVWYALVRGIAAALFLMLIASVFGAAANSPNVSCRGLLCGKGATVSAVLYLFALFLLIRGVLNARLVSYVLTDKTITIDSGVVTRSSCSIRFDRIQDVRTTSDPLRLLFGLKAVSIWTASPDQRAGNKQRPDGSLLIAAQDADWLGQYLSDPQATHSAVSAIETARAAQPERSSGAGLAVTLVLGAVVALALWGVWKIGGLLHNAQLASAPSAVAAPPVAASAPAPSTHPHLVRTPVLQPVASLHAMSSQYGIACALHGSGAAQGVMPCGTLDEAQRCSHETDFSSQPQSQPTQLTVVNRTSETLSFYWLNRAGVRALYATLPPGGHVTQPSHIGAHWLMTRQDGRCVAIFDAVTTTIGIL
jgi:membrane protein YdbS with pleckstrin-like domain